MVLHKNFLCAMIVVGLCSSAFADEKSRLGLHTRLNNGSKQSEDSIFTPQQWTAVKVAAGMVGTACVHYAADKIVGEGRGHNFYNGQYAWGFAQALKLSGACLSVAPLLNDEWGDVLFRWGMRAPVVGLSTIAIVHPNMQKLASYAPLGLGQHLSTYEMKKNDGESTWINKCGNDCHGICNRCLIPKVVLTVGLYKVMDPLLTKVGTALGQRCGFISEENHSDD